MENIKNLVESMTLEEKCLMLTGTALRTREIERLGIPAVRMSDGPHGVREYNSGIDGGPVCYPTASALGATWNRELVRKVGNAIADDCSKIGVEMILGPGVNMKRTPRCGRNFEYFSEDPYLSGELGAEYVNGVQERGIGTSLKHYAVNNQEIDRHIVSVEIDERTLREYYLKPFEIVCKKANPTSVMCAYNKLNGVWCSENKYLLNTILREEFGYDGMVVSDWGAVHNSSRAAAATLNLQMPEIKNVIERLKNGLEAGYVTMEEIDASVIKMLEFVKKVKEMHIDNDDYDRKKQHQVAYEAAAEAITMLKNDDNLLPITGKKYRRIDVRGLGLFGDTPKIQGGGSSLVPADKKSIDIPIDYIKKYAEEEGIELIYEPTVEPQDNLDMRVIFIGDGREHGFEQEGENIDRHFIDFCSYVNKEVNDACDKCDKVLVIIQTGSASIPFRWNKKAKGIIQQWYTGEASGKAIADIIFGKVNPSGKLSESFVLKERDDLDYPGDGDKVWYKEGQMVGYRYYDENPNDLWYPFGHGVSYTTYEYSDLKLEMNDGKVYASLKVKNTGSVEGKETVQLYVHDVRSTVIKPYKKLCAFEKVFLNAGEEKKINFEIEWDAFKYYNVSLHKWVVEKGEYEILAGASAGDIRLKEALYLDGDDFYTLIDVKEVPWQT